MNESNFQRNHNEQSSSCDNNFEAQNVVLHASSSNDNASTSQQSKGAMKKTGVNNYNKKPKHRSNFYKNNEHYLNSNRNGGTNEWKPFHQQQHCPVYYEENQFYNDFHQKNHKPQNKYYHKNNFHEFSHKQNYNSSRNYDYYSKYGNDEEVFKNNLNGKYGRDKGQNYFHNKNRHRNKSDSNRNWKNSNKKAEEKFDIASQRERLEEMMKKKTLECLVCCEIFKFTDKVWSCKQCFHIIHLKCIQAWANSSMLENGWRCPACQNVCKEVPKEYRCFCGKLKEPKNEVGLLPHTCGDVCLRPGRSCEHRCFILCHPGPCPECSVTVNKQCGCGKTQQQVKCSSDLEVVCSNICDKTLACDLHKCLEKCHVGECKPCDVVVRQICFCGQETREAVCTLQVRENVGYTCLKKCGKELSCGNHKCEDVCHEGDCKPCSTDISLISTCFCGKRPLDVPRTSCLDPILSCGLLCHKMLPCGPPGAPHICKSMCHDGNCPPCDLTTVLKCRCGFMDKEIPCQNLTTKADDARCEKKCTKKRLCGKHKCNQRCCIEIEHICPLPCNHLLSCGNHRCGLTCHSGRCKPCVETSFEELYCECGSSVIYPPIPCGTRPPECHEPCPRQRECGHEVNHTCHTGPCPPCTVLCKRWCYGKHEQRGTIPCHQDNFSCGLPCGKRMPCGRHKCNKACHLGPCPLPCKQTCVVPRALCGHPCNAPCHEPPCPETNCRSKVNVSCVCGVQKGIKQCIEVIDEFRSIEMAFLSDKMLSMSRNQSVDISDISKVKKPDVLKILECTEECRVLERNRRLAIGLQIRNPDISQKLTPRYSDFIRQWAKKDPHFCQRVHDKLTELVQLAKQSKQKSRSYSFETMNRDKRHFIHEYCEHFGCESAAYDAEPNRNIVATALRDKSWLPSMSLMDTIQRENGQRKVPGPSVLNKSCSKTENTAMKPLGRTSGKIGLLQVNGEINAKK